MKKKIVALLMIMALGVSAVACGDSNKNAEESQTAKTEENSGSDEEKSDSSEESSEEETTFEINKDDIKNVKLGEYKNLKIKLEGDYSTDDEALDTYIDSNLTNTYEKDESKDTVKKNSIVNVDYEGKKDGVAFSGGTAQDVTIDVKNNMDAVNGTPYI
ncbi:MAG: hypothetical protein K6F00_03840, partial [Lachnospiraceae bacterium]|nr:hypothetical protein [Lachnospiraceae bacterium]